MTNLNKNPLLIAFGNLIDYETLFNKINNQFETNEKYKTSLNKLHFVKSTSKSDTALAVDYTININTKYYDLKLDLAVMNLHQTDLNQVKEKVSLQNNLQGVLLFLNNQHINGTLSEYLVDTLNHNDSCFKSVITCEMTDVHKIFIDQLDNQVDDLITINLTENSNDTNDEEAFTDLDELINSIFVHSWEDMTLKNETNLSDSNHQASNVKTSNESNVNTNDHEDVKEDPFNFEELLMNLTDYKAKADSLDFEERKKFAENVVLKFWESIGGDENEIGDLNEL